eukprot:Ihof_evm3s140 gene=Ihof_evmTU3s140
MADTWALWLKTQEETRPAWVKAVNVSWLANVQGTTAAHTALYTYEVRDEGEIALSEGEVVKVLAYEDEWNDDSWWKIERSDMVVGIVPGSYLSAIPPTGSLDYYKNRLRNTSNGKLIESDKDLPASPGPSTPTVLPPPLPTMPPSGSEDSLRTQNAPPVPQSVTEEQYNANSAACPPYNVVPPEEKKETSEAKAYPPDYEQSKEAADSKQRFSLDTSGVMARHASSTSGAYRLSTGSIGMEGEGEIGIPSVLDPRVYGEEPFIMAVIQHPRKTGLVSKALSWLVVTQTNFPEYAAKACENRREYEDFTWLRDTLAHECPNCLIPPVPEGVGAFGKMDEYYIAKRTMALQTFLDRIFRHKLLRSHPILHTFLECTPAELKRAKKVHKNVKKDLSKHVSDQQKPDRDLRMTKKINYYQSLNKNLKDMRERTEQQLKTNGQVGGFYGTANYSVPWEAMAEAEEQGSYLKRIFKALGTEVKTLDSSMIAQHTEIEMSYRQGVKDIIRYVKEAETFLDNICSLEDTTRYWTLQLQAKNEALAHKEASMELISGRAAGAEAAHAETNQRDTANNPALAAAIAKQEKKDNEKTKKAQKEQKALTKSISELKCNITELEQNLAEATKRMEEGKAVMWQELDSFDYTKDWELQSLHKQWLQSHITVHGE